MEIINLENSLIRATMVYSVNGIVFLNRPSAEGYAKQLAAELESEDNQIEVSLKDSSFIAFQNGEVIEIEERILFKNMNTGEITYSKLPSRNPTIS